MRPMTRWCSTLALIGAAAATGCATAELRKDGASAADRQADERACAGAASPLFPPGDPSMSNAVSIEMEQGMRKRAYLTDCMREQGWR